ncbi:MAG: iron-sulfur cluster assembly accessory protein [Chloroflexota bacterium]|nr:iron-sulfur cluster assembly accessory protein [Chloroflexota bacterium]
MITMTDTAKQALQRFMADEPSTDAGLRVYITPGGCSGFSYGMVLEDQIDQSDEVYEQDGVKLIVDRFSASMLDGAEIDYVESLMGAGFSVNNPSAVTTCGCGHSFRTAASAGAAQSCH